MDSEIKKALIIFGFVVAIIILAIGWAVSATNVRILPMRGPIGTAKISPGNGSATAYRMDFKGQKSICFRSVNNVDVYISSASSIGTDGFPLFTKGDTICYDLAGGTTLYFHGDGANSDIRATMAK